ncbi:hypothetical protein E1A91_A11G358600v1 [Gossypium mustelinum]|uniref:Uncharacterized protein n=1 Tax=Gossypium mustelinum TaxID=34275 RepID=A0A5D2XF23_GOSMU|nr:hypothetical protein E1A91_A11G358600v1 [Gossypium mustelinum]
MGPMLLTGSWRRSNSQYSLMQGSLLFIVAFEQSLFKHDNCRRYCFWKFIIPLYTELMKSLPDLEAYI